MHVSENGNQFKFHLYRSTQSWNQNNNIKQISIICGVFLNFKHETSNPEKKKQPNIASIIIMIVHNT